MNKSIQDGMDGMADILQKVLQIYAGTQISRARAQLQLQVAAALTGESQDTINAAIAEQQLYDSSPAAVLFEDLLHMNTDNWDEELRNRIRRDGDDDADETKVSAAALMGEVQRTIESVVLGLENGSMAQRVQAEYLREVASRIEALA